MKKKILAGFRYANERIACMFHAFASPVEPRSNCDAVVLGVLALMTALTVALAYQGLQLHVWRHDSLYYITFNEYFGKFQGEGRWLVLLLFWPLRYVPGNIAWILGLALFGFFMYVCAYNVAKDRLYAGIVALLCVQSIPLYLAGFWPAGTLVSYVLLCVAAISYQRIPLALFYALFGCLFLASDPQFYYLLPLLHLGQLTKGDRPVLRSLMVVIGLWVLGFVAGFLLVLTIKQLLVGSGWLRIDAWRRPHYIESSADLIRNIESRAGFLWEDLRATLQNGVGVVSIVIALVAGLRRSDAIYKAAAFVICASIVLAHYVITMPIGIVISMRSVIATFVGVLAFVFISPPGNKAIRGVLAVCALGMFSQYWMVNNDNLVWYRTVTSIYFEQLLRISPLPPSLYAGLVLVGRGSRQLEERVVRAYGLRRSYAEPLSETVDENKADVRWSAAAKQAGFRQVAFCSEDVGASCPEDLVGLKSGSCDGRDGVYCLRGVTPDNYLVVSFSEAHLVKLGERIGISRGARGVQYLGRGWSVPEDWGVWSDGRMAEMALPVATVPNSLVLEGHAMVSAAYPRQQVKIMVNGVEAGKVMITKETDMKWTISIPQAARDAIGQLGYMRLEFNFPDAVRPSDLGLNRDTRLLGFGLEAMTLF